MTDRLFSETAKMMVAQTDIDKRESMVVLLVAVENEAIAFAMQNARDTFRGMRDIDGKTPAEIISVFLGEPQD